MYDAIIIGLGSMGSATAFHLARRGKRVLGLEQFNIGHDLGSAHGVNRIIRLAYFEHPAYVPLLRRAYSLWRELEKQGNERLLFLNGSLDVGPQDGTVFPGSLESCRLHKLKHTILNSRELHARFPAWKLPRNMKGLLQPKGGFVLSERAVIAHITAAQANGADLRARERVLNWEPIHKQVLVQTDRGTYRAKKLVITAGAWTAKLLENLNHLAQPQRQVLIWTQPKDPSLFSLEAFPVFNLQTPENDRYYGFPIYGIPGFKLGKYYHLRQNVDPDTMDRECHAEDEEILRSAIRRFWPSANGPTMAMKTCLFSNSLDKHFVLDRHPDAPNVSIAAGFSGHGFKFASVIGEIMADFASHGHSPRFGPLDLFSIHATRTEAD